MLAGVALILWALPRLLALLSHSPQDPSFTVATAQQDDQLAGRRRRLCLGFPAADVRRRGDPVRDALVRLGRLAHLLAPPPADRPAVLAARPGMVVRRDLHRDVRKRVAAAGE